MVGRPGRAARFTPGLPPAPPGTNKRRDRKCSGPAVPSSSLIADCAFPQSKFGNPLSSHQRQKMMRCNIEHFKSNVWKLQRGSHKMVNNITEGWQFSRRVPSLLWKTTRSSFRCTYSFRPAWQFCRSQDRDTSSYSHLRYVRRLSALPRSRMCICRSRTRKFSQAESPLASIDFIVSTTT